MVTVLFDSTRLFMRASMASPTGIDRVTAAYGRWLLSRPDVEVVPVCSWGGVISPMSLGKFRRILGQKYSPSPAERADWVELSAALAAPASAAMGVRAKADRDPLAGKLTRYAVFAARTIAHWRPTRYEGNAIYLNVSHFGLEQPRLLERLTA